MSAPPATTRPPAPAPPPTSRRTHLPRLSWPARRSPGGAAPADATVRPRRRPWGRHLRGSLGTAAVVAACALAGWMFSPAFATGALDVPVGAVAVTVAVATVATTRGGLAPSLRLVAGALLGLLAVVETLLAGTTVWGLPTGRTLRALREGAVDSWAVALDSLWPARAEPGAVLFVPLLVLICSLLAAHLVERRPLAALVPPLLLAVLAQAWTPARGVAALGWAAGFGALCVLVLASRRTPGEGGRTTPLPPGGAGHRLRAAVTLVAAGTVGLTALGWLTLLDRPPVSLKEHREASALPTVTRSPLDDVAARLQDPERVLFTVRTSSPVDRWTLAVLDSFDGRRWTTSERFEPMGARLEADPAVSVPTRAGRALVVVHDLRGGPWLVSHPRTRQVDGLLPLVGPRTGTLVTGRDTTDLRYELTWSAPEVDPARVAVAALAPDALPPLPGPVRERMTPVARQLAGTSTASVSAALALEGRLAAGYTLVTDRTAVPAGHSLPDLERFLATDRRGSSEQFAAAYVVLAQALGIPARLAVGFRHPRTVGVTGIDVRNRDVLAWPEVLFRDLGWVALDPTRATSPPGQPSAGQLSPGQQSPGQLSPPAGPVRSGTNALPPPSAAPTSPSSSPPAPAAPGGAGAPREPDGFPFLAAIASALLAVPLCWLVGVPLLKALRRRRRRGGPPARAVLGAWREAGDRLAEHGVTLPASATARDLARQARGTLGTEQSLHLVRLARCVDRALWSPRDPSPSLAVEAWEVVDAVRADLRNRPLRSRLRASWDLRPLVHRAGRTGDAAPGG